MSVRSVNSPWLPAAGVLLATGWGANQFSPMLLVYSRSLDLGTGSLEALFGVYALGLIPGLLLAGPVSDARGRRAVVLPAAVLSLAATVTLALGGSHVALLYAARLMAGVASGVVFGAGTAWLQELSAPPFEDAARSAPRRAAVAMTAGFAIGPLAAGLIAQWAPAPDVLPYAPHLALMALALGTLRSAPETVRATRGRVTIGLPDVRHPRFRTVVAPMAPWVFAAPAIAFALLPSVVGAEHAADGIALTATITGLCALAGVLVQPLGRRLDVGSVTSRAATAGLIVLAAGLVLAAVTAESREPLLLVPSAVVLGSAYGLCLVAGLTETQRLADGATRGALTSVYYALTYLGFGAPYLLAAAANAIRYSFLFCFAATLALATAAQVTRAARRLSVS